MCCCSKLEDKAEEDSNVVACVVAVLITDVSTFYCKWFEIVIVRGVHIFLRANKIQMRCAEESDSLLLSSFWILFRMCPQDMIHKYHVKSKPLLLQPMASLFVR